MKRTLSQLGAVDSGHLRQVRGLGAELLELAPEGAERQAPEQHPGGNGDQDGPQERLVWTSEIGKK